MENIKIGKIVNTFGIKGELKIVSQSEFIEERFKKGNQILLQRNQELKPVTIESMRVHQGNVIVKLKEYPTMNEAEELKGFDLYIAKSQIPRLKDGFYLFELEGLDVYLDNNKIGIVKKADKLTMQTILRIQTDQKEVLIPFVDAFIKEVNLDENRIDIMVIEGML